MMNHIKFIKCAVFIRGQKIYSLQIENRMDHEYFLIYLFHISQMFWNLRKIIA